jgi:hypothetical protein
MRDMSPTLCRLDPFRILFTRYRIADDDRRLRSLGGISSFTRRDRHSNDPFDLYNYDEHDVVGSEVISPLTNLSC